ncbi:DUF2157 domain-containing protein [Gracilibacillus caseinilyticus]|uniref:DUF2157 domain-containing protein n=1 Tax=Gracilibacillus caseinilyticus TaxID=2932256 RepID=A0ABY4ER46_9BACI|nr:DUF2157 domain-containing protein [Gracilibacillus caseinilyticus]UOQ46896.1 DUF2157 domain-containing protein [Gracilibacillus caseinilyticus]
MNKQQIAKEAKKWLDKDIIDISQYHQIVGQYENKDRTFLLLLFASLFIGLGFLTFVASNLNSIPDLVNMAVIMVFMLIYYVTGEHLYRKRSEKVGISIMIIGLFIFGAGIFLTGQMYHYVFDYAFPFLIWAIASFGFFILYKHPAFFVLTFTIMTIGQVYNGIMHQSFYLWLFIFFLLSGLYYVYRHTVSLYGKLFAIGYLLQGIVMVAATDLAYYWIVVPFLLLYIMGDLSINLVIQSPFRWYALLGAFVLSSGETFFLSSYQEYTELEWFPFYAWLVVFIIAILCKYWRKDKEGLTDLVLFLPVIFAGAFADHISMASLFIFSLGYLFSGYKVEDQFKIGIGTGAFLISTCIAYFHLAWAFLDKSLFFFVGGILLFAMSYFLERKRRHVKKEATR